MTVLPRRVLLAIAAVLDVALLARVNPLPAKALADRHDLAPRQFEALLQTLVRAKILKSLRGPRGGYELARERRRISLGDIIRAVDGAREGRAASLGSPLIEKIIEPAVAEAGKIFVSELDRVSIEDLCIRADATEQAGQAHSGADFTI